MRRLVVAIAVTSILGVTQTALAGEAGLIIRNGDEIDQMCVAFDGDETTGAELLAGSGIDYVEEEGSLGTAICSIEGEGCGRDNCFCRYPEFWGYWTKDDDTEDWRFSDVGASERAVRTGTLDGWSFGRDGKPAPPDLAFESVCSAQAARPAGGERLLLVRPNYVPFVAFVGVLVVAGLVAVRVRRRRTGR
ncbi:MAG: hypothetical protein WD826_10115 [Actinomycetota bacterium]